MKAVAVTSQSLQVRPGTAVDAVTPRQKVCIGRAVVASRTRSNARAVSRQSDRRTENDESQNVGRSMSLHVAGMLHIVIRQLVHQ